MAIIIAVGDNMRITLKGKNINGDDMLNVFHYNFYAGSGTDVLSHRLDNFAFGFWENIKAALRALTVVSAAYQEVEAVVLDDDFLGVNGESFVIPVGEQPGLLAGESANQALCLTYRYVRPNFSFRHGYKRFGGLGETSMAGNVVAGASVALAETLRVRLQADIAGLYSDGSPLVDPPDARPIVYRRVVEGTVISPVLWGVPIGVVLNGIGTQNTRKAGRGS